MSVQSPVSKLHRAVDLLTSDYRVDAFDPHVEADIAGYIYHLWIREHREDSKWLHLEARLNLQDRPRWHSDLVYGKPDRNGRDRPYVVPQLVVEIKSFCGFTRDQFSPRKKSLCEDIEFLGGNELGQDVKRALVVFLVVDVPKLQKSDKKRISEDLSTGISEMIQKQSSEINWFIVKGTERGDSTLHVGRNRV